MASHRRAVGRGRGRSPAPLARALANARFRTQTLHSITGGIGLLVVDEAHCISDGGHDFRPDYRRIQRIVGQLPRNIPMLATTATANDRVVADVDQQLGPDLTDVPRPAEPREPPNPDRPARRPGRTAGVARREPPGPAGLGNRLRPDQADPMRVSDWLTSYGIDAPAYYAGRTRGPRRPRASPPPQRPQGARCDDRPRHGIRQARPWLRRPLPATRLPYRVLPADRPGGPPALTPRTWFCSPAARTTTSPTTSSAACSHRRRRSPRCSTRSTLSTKSPSLRSRASSTSATASSISA